MNEPETMTLEALKLTFDFLSNNSIEIVVVCLLLICRKSISDLISRLTSLSFKNGKSQLGLTATHPDQKEDEEAGYRTEDEKPSSSNTEVKETEVEIERNSQEWIAEMYHAFDEGRLDDAELAFKQSGLVEKDEVKLEENKAFYLFLRFQKGQDNSAITDLEKLSRNAVSEESKFNTLMWLSFCLTDSMQYQKETEIWKSALKDANQDSFKIKALVNLSNSLLREGLFLEAKNYILNHLPAEENDNNKASLYEVLSNVEKKLGNNAMSIYCKDKSLEFDVNNRAELFRSAYDASEDNIDEISISNYIKLLKIDQDNSTALNNLGVRAQEAGFKIIAVNQYKKAAQKNNTLSIANQGFLLLGSGFIDEAEEIAKEALKEEKPHQNIHNLLAEIRERKEKQEEGWEELTQKSLSRQKEIREYTEQYYLGDPASMEGKWSVNGLHPVAISTDNGSIEANWIEDSNGLGGSVNYAASLNAKVSGSTIKGTYKRKLHGEKSSLLVGLDVPTEKSVIGYLTNQGKNIRLISQNMQDGFEVSFFRNE